MGKKTKSNDKDFLRQMDEKLHEVNQKMFQPNLCGKAFPVQYDTYTEEKINESELGQILKIATKVNYVIMPMNTNMGFSVGYEVAQVVPTKQRSLLKFKETQLPKEWDFQRMSAFFMQKPNLIKALILGEKITNDYDRYDY